MTMPPNNQPKKPTIGQRTQLERISTAAWALIGEQAHAGEPISYYLIERETGREIHALTATMVESLLREGWIEPDGSSDRHTPSGLRRWGYRITLEGIHARDRGWG